eukprot:1320505-Rhodomonas_salina.1
MAQRVMGQGAMPIAVTEDSEERALKRLREAVEVGMLELDVERKPLENVKLIKQTFTDMFQMDMLGDSDMMMLKDNLMNVFYNCGGHCCGSGGGYYLTTANGARGTQGDGGSGPGGLLVGNTGNLDEGLGSGLESGGQESKQGGMTVSEMLKKVGVKPDQTKCIAVGVVLVNVYHSIVGGTRRIHRGARDMLTELYKM